MAAEVQGFTVDKFSEKGTVIAISVVCRKIGLIQYVGTTIVTIDGEKPRRVVSEKLMIHQELGDLRAFSVASALSHPFIDTNAELAKNPPRPPSW